ncbi:MULTISPECIES: ExeM/NucH family extracellular endonuclease [unclassified Pseudoalteromonas]|uniref:ExeM/NucH family extracellular endonuclease n=1 Tax=unclassified Pseudoalteromonas TaxID=194690 RepID=UPI000FFEF6AF|nr:MULTISPECIES: ExeM/NucH family extracellular endonuclease [unclassified Pseudoalteromonas]MCG9760167.1 ExeM/NucH family extracellular endonuclease [Pseudoalteromonas sp. Isolate6]RXE85872.1 DNA degradation protein EddB [Pseudoalteromonas sp. A757]
MIKKSILASAIALACLNAQAEVIISEYVEGSSYNKAIELYNGSDEAVSLTGYSVNFFFNGATEARTNIELSGELAAKSTYVIAHADSAAEIIAKAQLTNTSSWFNGDDAVTLTLNGAVVDSLGQVGVDPGSEWVDGDIRTKDKTLVRDPAITTGRTDATSAFVGTGQWLALAKNDFSNLGIHINGGDVPEPEPVICGENNTLISAIQGAGDASPLAGETVEVQAVVTASLQSDAGLGGFFLQEESTDYDADNNTSEGIFVVYTATPVSAGDVVKLRGKVEEKYGQTQLINVDAVELCGSATASATTVTLPAENGLEAYEGMLVSISNELVVNDTYGLARYGEVRLGTERLYQSTQVATPGDAANQLEAENKRKEILLDDGSSVQNPDVIPYPSPTLDAYNTLRLGDSVTGLEGVLGYGYSQYRIHPTTTPNFVHTNLRTEAPQIEERGDLRIASFNVLNYFNGDGQGAGFPTSRGADNLEEFERQKAKTVAAISALDADIIGLLEVENDGFGEFSAIADLVNALNATDSANTYAFVNLNVDQVGGDAITSGIIYRSNKVAEVGTPAFTEAVPFDYGNRPPVVQTFKEANGEEIFTVVMAHLRSKGSCSKAEGLDQDQNDGQGCWNQTRVTAVNTLATWLGTNPTGVAEDDVIILGDMNAYAQEDPINTYVENGYANIKQTLHGSSLDYSYVYQGRIGSLDHAFASNTMMEKVKSVTDWHINADEPVALDYNTEYKSDTHKASLYATHAYRASDHDPVVIDLNLAKEPTIIEGEFTGLAGWFWWQHRSIELPAGFDKLEVSITGQGEADLYVRHQRMPNFFKYDCRPYLWGSEESCVFDEPAEGKWNFRLRGLFPYYNVTIKYKATKAN